MTHSKKGPTRRAIRYALVAVLAAALIDGTVTAGKKDDLQKKIAAGSFSKINYRTGMKRANQLFANVMRKNEYKKSEEAPETLFSKNLNSTASTAFINKMGKQFSADHGMRRSTFDLADKYVDPAGNLHIIMTQRIDKVKVKVAKVALHFNKEGELYDLSGQVQEDADIVTSPRIGEEEAVALGKKAVDGQSEVFDTPKLSIVGGKLTYAVLLSEGDIPGAWEVTIDARSGEALGKTSTLRFFDAVYPPGWPSNGSYADITGNIYEYEGGYEVTANAWHDNDGQYYLINDTERWHIMRKPIGLSVPVMYSNPSQDWGNSSPQGMSLAYNFGNIITFVSDSMGRNCYDNAGSKAEVYLFEDGMGNGFWSSGVFYLHTGTDVTEHDCVVLDFVAHEYGHAMTEFASGLIIVGTDEESASLNEAYSDIFAACVEEAFQPDGRDQYPFGRHSTMATSEWLIGEDIFIDGGQRWWCRNMREPLVGGNEGNHPSLYFGTEWRPTNEEHCNSTILSHAFYLLSEGVGIERINDPNYLHSYGPFRGLGIGAARKIAWGAQFNGRILPTSDYKAARNAWIATAQELWYDAGLVAQVFAAVGVIDRTVGRPAGTNLPTNPPNHTSISAAIASADEGDLIYVYPGTYVENLTITEPNITIVSRNRELTTIDGTVNINADGITLTGFTIDASPVTTAVSINGSSLDEMQGVTISNNSIRNCDKGVSVSYGYFNSIINNQFQSGNGGSIAIDNSSLTIMQENTFDGGGMFFGLSNGSSWASYNRWNDVTTDGVRFDNSSWNVMFTQNEFVSVGGSDITGSFLLFGMSCNHNVFNTRSGLNIYLPNIFNGSFYANTFSPNTYTINVPSSYNFNTNYWSDYNGEDTDGDGLGETNLPHAGRDYSPLMTPQARAINFSHSGSLLMASTVRDGKFRVAGTADGGTPTGLKFGANNGLTTSGNLVGSQILINSGRWLDEETNLTGGLVLRDAEGMSQMHISTDGIVRTRSNLTPKF